MTVLSTPRLLLRQWRASDHEPFARLNSDPAVMEFMSSTLDRTASDRFAEEAAAEISRQGWGLWAVELREGAAFIGFAGLRSPSFEAHFTPCVEIGWRLERTLWGRGFATEAARECLRFAFETLGLREVVSFTVPGNRRSRAVMERLGMRRDPDDDFDHPRLPPGHRLRRHLLYRLARED
ncbi:MAG TPA: GNAT family N-acetyltransferase [Steroidobacteraceae bacterium]|nr:GNAT family N-acetyltransferase [Steroidobacteraceae bacterium]